MLERPVEKGDPGLFDAAVLEAVCESCAPALG